MTDKQLQGGPILRTQLEELQDCYQRLHRDMETIASRSVPSTLPVAEFAAAAIADALATPLGKLTSTVESERWYAAGDVDGLVRELDVLINGEEGAADQAQLCDVVAQLRARQNKANPYMGTGAVESIVTDEELASAWGNANFGGMTPRSVVRLGVLKCASGYYQGYTSKTIGQDLGLINDKYELTPKGRMYLWQSNKGSGDV